MSAMEAALCPLGEHLSCQVCKKNLAERVKQLVVQWSVVKVCQRVPVCCAPLYAGARRMYDARTDSYARRGRYDDVMCEQRRYDAALSAATTCPATASFPGCHSCCSSFWIPVDSSDILGARKCPNASTP